VIIRLASWTRWKASTLTFAFGRAVVMALRNAADGSIATTCTRSRHVWERASSQDCTLALSRPSMIPRTCPLSALTNVLIQGSTRRHGPPG